MIATMSKKGAARAHQLSYEREGKQAEPYSRERLEEDIDICLTCERDECKTGRCNKILESRRAIARERKNRKFISAE